MMPVPAHRSRRVRRALVLALVAAVPALVAWRRALGPVDAVAYRVDRGAVAREVTGIGALESPREVPLGFEQQGRLAAVLADEGDRVRAGQVVATLDPADARHQLAVASANLGLARAAVPRAQAERARAQASLRRAETEDERAAGLFTRGAVSTAERDATAERRAAAEAEVRALAAAIVQAERAEQAARQVVALQRHAADEARLASPIDGLVVRRHREPGHVVGPGAPVLTVVSTEALWVRAWVDETALGALRPGQAATITLRSHPGEVFPGRVLRVARQVDRQTHEVLVDVVALSLPAMYAVGQRADVRIAVDRRADVVRVPRGACDVARGACAVVRGGRAATAPVRFGLEGRDHVEVRSGLRPGDVVARGPDGAAVAEGRPLRLRSAP